VCFHTAVLRFSGLGHLRVCGRLVCYQQSCQAAASCSWSRLSFEEAYMAAEQQGIEHWKVAGVTSPQPHLACPFHLSFICHPLLLNIYCEYGCPCFALHWKGMDMYDA
jgi:hypothetical protein